ncbi:dihydrofolate reductase family protein [Methanoculleus sp.]|uniref:dihydrofolate reductase family protein n=1 Tax=Methanoculleus sp. TaxID=90427 RepID=UPI0025F2BED7|nr:dihydrofolate reductase family protein [Methanoculleus sp.]
MDISEPETEADRHRPEMRPHDRRPLCVIVDSRGVLKDLLHFYRNMEHTKDVVVLVSETTPEDYLDYLREREYPFIRCGRERVVSDSGPDLNNILIQEGIADTISLIVHPVIAGDGEKKLFDRAGGRVTLELQKAVPMEQGTVHLVYAVKK